MKQKTKTPQTVITLSEWEDYEGTRSAGTMNMFGHWNIVKFATGDNYSKAREHFEVNHNTADLVIGGEK